MNKRVKNTVETCPPVNKPLDTIVRHECKKYGTDCPEMGTDTLQASQGRTQRSVWV